jgi:lipopolysaccharide/colanic/teichoic acid biosynthesis glycosyltransferase
MPPPVVRVTKRLIDIGAATVGMVVVAPLFPLIALAVRMDSEGPIFFRQRRAGQLKDVAQRGGRSRFECEVFDMFKFRTMSVDAEKGTGAVFAAVGDPRITRVGRFLRKSRLDELPQLWNVLRGDMSLVGPRPERPELVEDLALAIPYFEERMRDVKPGITGLAQVSLGYTGAIDQDSELADYRDVLQNPFGIPEAEGALADDLRAKLLYDLAYSAALETFSTYLATELKVLFKTPLVMLKGVGR